MSFKAVAWTLLAISALALVLLLNYWASYQPLSTLTYSGIALAVCGLANTVLPFRFLGVHKRRVGMLVLASGVALTFAALWWPAPTIRVAQPGSQLDEIMPEYECVERHSVRIHARPEQVMQAVRQSTFGDMKSLITLLKIRGVVVRDHSAEKVVQDQRILQAFADAKYLFGGSDHEIVMAGVWNAREQRRPDVNTLQEFVKYRDQGGVKMAYAFNVSDAGDGWSTIVTETRVQALDDLTRRGMGRYWRLIVPGSGLLRLQWLDGIKRRAESMPNSQA